MIIISALLCLGNISWLMEYTFGADAEEEIHYLALFEPLFKFMIQFFILVSLNVCIYLQVSFQN